MYCISLSKLVLHQHIHMLIHINTPKTVVDQFIHLSLHCFSFFSYMYWNDTNLLLLEKCIFHLQNIFILFSNSLLFFTGVFLHLFFLQFSGNHIESKSISTCFYSTLDWYFDIFFLFAHQVEEEDKIAPLIVVSPAHLINCYEKCLQDNNYFGTNCEKVMPFLALVCTR